MTRRNKKIWRKQATEKAVKISQLSNKTVSSEWSSRRVLLLHGFIIIFKYGLCPKSGWGRDFFLLLTVQTSPGASLQWLPGLFPGARAAGSWRWQPPSVLIRGGGGLSSPAVAKNDHRYTCTPNPHPLSSWQVIGWDSLLFADLVYVAFVRCNFEVLDSRYVCNC